MDDKGQPGDPIAVPAGLFDRDYNEGLIHQVIVAYQANGRQGTRAQKDRGEVNKSNRKPWKQKGTGRARAGRASSPLWRGGGKIFPSSPDENFSQKVNRKMYRAAMCSILSQLVREDRLRVIDSLAVDVPKTKALAQKLSGMGVNAGLIITETVDDKLYLASRNLREVMVIEPRQADPVSLVRCPRVFITRAAIIKLEEMWS
jgi:large subunit ribosomal protein L4